MPSGYTVRRINALRERGRMMAKARWKADRQRQELEMPARIREIAEIDAINMPRKKGDALGCLKWTDYRSGKVRKWIVRIGDRADRITVEAPGGKASPSHGWTWFLT
jgi:hypothetical protein